MNCPELEVIADGEGNGLVKVNCAELEVIAMRSSHFEKERKENHCLIP